MEVELRYELQRQEREILQDRRKLQQNKRRAQRRNDVKLSRSSIASDKAMTTTSLSDIEAVTNRTGFLREQLQLTSLTPLRRWYLELKMMSAEDVKTQLKEGDDMETALQAFETTLSRSQRCYDVVYREGVRVSDAKDSLLDNAPISVRELLSFSTRSDKFICRVTCLHDGKQTHFTSTLYIENLQTQLDLLLTKQSHIDAVIAFIWSALQL